MKKKLIVLFVLSSSCACGMEEKPSKAIEILASQYYSPRKYPKFSPKDDEEFPKFTKRMSAPLVVASEMSNLVEQEVVTPTNSPIDEKTMNRLRSKGSGSPLMNRLQKQFSAEKIGFPEDINVINKQASVYTDLEESKQNK